MPYLVKIIINEDGEKEKDPKWHLVVHRDSPRALCTGEVFVLGEGNAVYRDRTTERGGITCEECLKEINFIKAVKL